MLAPLTASEWWHLVVFHLIALTGTHTSSVPVDETLLVLPWFLTSGFRLANPTRDLGYVANTQQIKKMPMN